MTRRRPPIRIVCDYRERRGQLYRLLQEHDDVELEVASLSVGDYIVEDRITVERKTWTDLLQSLRSGRLFRQVAALKHRAERPVLIIEGIAALDVAARVTTSVRGALTSVSVMWYLPVLWAADPAEAAALLATIGRQWTCDRRETWAPPPQRPKRGEDPRMPILRCLPGIGPDLARGLLDHFGSIGAICNATEHDLIAVHGIGRRRAAAIHGLLHADASART